MRGIRSKALGTYVFLASRISDRSYAQPIEVFWNGGQPEREKDGLAYVY